MDYEKIFVELSSYLTGFSVSELEATGLAKDFLPILIPVLGKGELQEMHAQAEIISQEGWTINSFRWQLRKPVQQIIALWYTGKWFPDGLPVQPESNSDKPGEEPRRVSIASYREALVWRVIKRNPSGIKWPGWASWEKDPKAPFENLF